MAKTHAETRFETARKRLSESLKTLEKTVKEKLHQAAIESKMLDVSENEEEAQAKVVQQETIIQNLNEEINNLQKNLSDLGKEADFLNEKNRTLSEKISDSRNEKKSLLEAIEADLTKIENIINKE
jgi:chromosome segregation ATPase